MYSFKNYMGNEGIVRNLKNMVANDKVSHAYIISGAKGLGKRLLANIFAKLLQCEDSSEKLEPCDKCSSCISFNTGNNPDIFYVRPFKRKSIGVDDIRDQVVRNVDVKQYKYKYKIFIIEEADTMTIQAQNALLKTLEEPPGYAIFLLLADNADMFLPTVISRCVSLKLKPLVSGKVFDFLISVKKVDYQKAKFLSEFCGGSIGRALQLESDETFNDMRHDTIDVLTNIRQKDLIGVMDEAKSLEKYKDNLEFLDICYMWYRDILPIISITGIDGERFVIQKDKLDKLVLASKFETDKSIIEKIEAVSLAKKELRANSNFLLTVEVMLLKIKESYSL